jgi:hypothetical protein
LTNRKNEFIVKKELCGRDHGRNCGSAPATAWRKLGKARKFSERIFGVPTEI